jgi:DNA-binding GntR family transcriptional regulator
LEKEAVAIFAVEASDETIARLKAQHEAVLRQAETDPITLALVAEAQGIDWAMHDTIIDAVANQIVSKSYQVNSLKIRLIHQSRTRINGHVVPVMREHLGIIAAIEARDPAVAVERLARHITGARDRALGLR